MNAWATSIFSLALLHTFLTSPLRRRFPKGLAHFVLGEIELVFPLWSIVYLLGLTASEGLETTHRFLTTLSFAEPLFVGVVLLACANRPMIALAAHGLEQAARLVPLPRSQRFFFSILCIGPLLGSFITEPAAMTLSAILLMRTYFGGAFNRREMALTVGTLFVNVSVGGALTPFAAPPVVMVARTFGWDFSFMLEHFALRSILTTVLTSLLLCFLLRRTLARHNPEASPPALDRIPQWIQAIHAVLLVAVVFYAHHPEIEIVLLGGILAFSRLTRPHQDAPRYREATLVASFLAGIIVIGTPQRWWLEPLLQSLEPRGLYFLTTALTAITDNAALTYLGAQVQGLSTLSKELLVAGSLVGGGLTVIANAPNPIGYSILGPSFGKRSLGVLELLLAASAPTAIAFLIFGIH